MKVLPRPNKVTVHKDQYMPQHCDQCSKRVQPIWGHSTRQLKLGGPWDPEQPFKYPVDPQTGKPRYHQRVKNVGTMLESMEPEFSESSFDILWEIVRFLWRSGRCETCIIAILSNHDYKGCSYARYDWSAVERIIDLVDSTDSDPTYSSQVSDTLSSIVSSGEVETIDDNKKEEYIFTPQTKTVQMLLSWLGGHPGCSQTEFIDARLISHRDRSNRPMMYNYIKYMEAEGFIQFENVKTGGRGKPRKVWSPIEDQIEMDMESFKLTDEQIFALLNGE